jgi:predicted outer membrane repeat protein
VCNLFIQHKGGEKIRKQAITCRYLISLLLISITLLFCASTAFAADEAIFVNGLSGNDENDGYTPDTAKLTIRNATGTVSSNGVITIADGVYTGTANTDIIIERNMTIQGQSQAGTIIYGTGTSRIFSIPSGINVTLSNLTFINGNSTNGGAIYNNGILTVTDTTFAGNNATGYGGAIYNHHKLTVTDCTFIGNIASTGGAIMNGGTSTVTGSTFTSNRAIQNDGGAIYTDGTLTVTNSTLTGNLATRHGGAIYSYDTLTITSSNFDSNAAIYNGEAIFNNGASTVTSSTFTDNNALSPWGCGGAIYNDRNLMVNGGTFTGNNAGYEGGAIFNRDTSTVTGSTFTGNSVTEGNGGAIYNGDSLTMTGSNFTNNTANSGGAIYNNNQLIASNSTFFKNMARYGGAICSEGDVTMHFNRIVENTAQYGSAIYNSKGDVNVTDNWWGSNDPDFETLIDGDANYSPWLYVTFSADPLSTPQGSTSTLTASFNQDTDGTTINQLDPAHGHIPDGSPVTFTTTLGNVGSKSVMKYTVNGIATAILRADEAAGSAAVGLLADSQPLTSTVTITPVSAATTTRVNAATSNTIGMQSTGAPIVPLALAVLSVLGGLTATRKKQ